MYKDPAKKEGSGGWVKIGFKVVRGPGCIKALRGSNLGRFKVYRNIDSESSMRSQHPDSYPYP